MDSRAIKLEYSLYCSCLGCLSSGSDHVRHSPFAHTLQAPRKSPQIPPPPPPSRHSPTTTPNPHKAPLSGSGNCHIQQSMNDPSSAMETTRNSELHLCDKDPMTYKHFIKTSNDEISFPFPAFHHGQEEEKGRSSTCSWTEGDDSTELGTLSATRSLYSEAGTINAAELVSLPDSLDSKGLMEHSKCGRSPVMHNPGISAFPPRTSSNNQSGRIEYVDYSKQSLAYPSTPTPMSLAHGPCVPNRGREISLNVRAHRPTTPKAGTMAIARESATNHSILSAAPCSSSRKYNTLPSVLRPNDVSYMDLTDDEDGMLARTSILPFLSGRKSKRRFRHGISGAFRRLSCST